MMQWQQAMYTRNPFLDVPGVGRYLIKREQKGSRVFRVYLNNTRTAYYGTVDECKVAVEGAVRSREMVNKG
jgi:hypothetical protein